MASLPSWTNTELLRSYPLHIQIHDQESVDSAPEVAWALENARDKAEWWTNGDSVGTLRAPTLSEWLSAESFLLASFIISTGVPESPSIFSTQWKTSWDRQYRRPTTRSKDCLSLNCLMQTNQRWKSGSSLGKRTLVEDRRIATWSECSTPSSSLVECGLTSQNFNNWDVKQLRRSIWKTQKFWRLMHYPFSWLWSLRWCPQTQCSAPLSPGLLLCGRNSLQLHFEQELIAWGWVSVS